MQQINPDLPEMGSAGKRSSGAAKNFERSSGKGALAGR
jgi:hypothetical protein